MRHPYGIRLENSRARIEKEIQSGDYPDLAVSAGEALDSVISLHGPMIASTEHGRELIEEHDTYHRSKIDTATYKPVALAMAEVIHDNDLVATPDAQEIVLEATKDIDEGARPDRSTQFGRIALSNFLIVAAQALDGAFRQGHLKADIESALRDGNKTLVKWAYVGGVTAVGGAALAGAAYAAPALWAFFLANKTLLHQLAMVAGGELSWLPSFLNCLERMQTKLKL